MTFTLTDHRGKPKLMRDGTPFKYSSRATAKAAKLLFEAEKDCMTVYRITEVVS
ncbi:MAG: hypothetical protein JWP85_2106 [Rhodoglobus sp.]|nr:hypothetical protein [Rhodoglobus sp.]